MAKVLQAKLCLLMDTRLEFREQLSEYSEERHKEQPECERHYSLVQFFAQKFVLWLRLCD